MTAFWDTVPCSLGASALIMDAVGTTETSTNFHESRYWTLRSASFVQSVSLYAISLRTIFVSSVYIQVYQVPSKENTCKKMQDSGSFQDQFGNHQTCRKITFC
jgi:hypothetical protein